MSRFKTIIPFIIGVILYILINYIMKKWWDLEFCYFFIWQDGGIIRFFKEFDSSRKIRI